jgi:hypothetical protein
MTKVGNKKLTTKISFNRNIGKRTSIGHSTATRPKNKDARRQYKPMRGQGHP